MEAARQMGRGREGEASLSMVRDEGGDGGRLLLGANGDEGREVISGVSVLTSQGEEWE